MNKNQIKSVLEKHKLYLLNDKDGELANLTGADLSSADLRNASLRNASLRNASLRNADLYYADLRNANLRYANLYNANLRYADLRYADLSNASLRNADLRYADLSNANLRYADLSNANLYNANLSGANLSNADLYNANLSGANLSNANLRNIIINLHTIGITMCCPEEGSFIAWKKCANNTLVKLFVTEDAKRSSATTRKCRVSKVKVLNIYDDKGKEINSTYSAFDIKFKYVTNEIIEVKNFDTDRWNECSTGIHCFTSKLDAKAYSL